MAKMSAARKRHPEITLSLSMSAGAACGGCVRGLFLAEAEVGRSGDSDLSPFLLGRHRGVSPARGFKPQVDRLQPHSVRTSRWRSVASPRFAFTCAGFPTIGGRSVHAVHSFPPPGVDFLPSRTQAAGKRRPCSPPRCSLAAVTSEGVVAAPPEAQKYF